MRIYYNSNQFLACAYILSLPICELSVAIFTSVIWA